MQMKIRKSFIILLSAVFASLLILAGAFMFTPKTTAHAESTTTDVYWKLDEGVLTLRSDQIDNTYKSRNSVDWYESRLSIQEVVIANTIAPSDTSDWFSNCINLTTITNLSNLDTSNVTSMRSMFYSCSALTSLDVSLFNTQNVTDMVYMFGSCNGLTSLNVSNFDTSNVTGMGNMFYDCSKLTSLNVSNFDTSNVTGMGFMFDGCSSLTSLNVSNFDTSNVTCMDKMFRGCSSLTSLNVSNFDTSNVTSMNQMFYGCSKLTSLDVSSFDTSKVTNIGSMFGSCSSLTFLDLSKFDTTNITYASYMFSSCNNLNIIHTPNTVGSVALPLPCEFWDSDADSDADDNVKFINSITSVNAGHTIYRHQWGHTGGTATCTTKAVCDICGENYGDLAEHDCNNGDWVSDANSHWHECNNGCGEKGEEALHEYNQEIVSNTYLKSAATCTAKAVYYKSCECGAHGTETFEYGEIASHTSAEAERENEVAATCTQAGSYDEVVYCSICGEELSRTQKTTDINPDAHNFGEWTVVKQATESEEGEERRVCENDNNHYETRTIPKLTPSTPTPTPTPEKPSAPAEENKSYLWLFWLLIPLAIGVGGVTLGIWEYKKDKKNNR